MNYNNPATRYSLAPLVAFSLFISSFISSAHAQVASSEYFDLSKNFGQRQLGTVGFDSSSFLYQSKARGTSSTTVEGEIHGSFDTSVFHGQGDAEFYSFIANKPQVGIESRELYIANQEMGFGQFTIGRRYYEWSKVDKTWDMMSLWSPRFTWDQLHPETIGMTGAFYSFEGKYMKAYVYASPISIPERGTPVYEENGNIVSPNPFWIPLKTKQTVMGTETDIQYHLMTPPMKDILLRPSIAAKVRGELGDGFWTSAGAGVLPVHMVQMAAEPYLDSQNGAIVVNIRPQLPMRNIFSLEGGYEAPEKDWSLWGSASYEQPFQFENQSNWLNPIITPATIISAGTDVQLTSNFWFTGSALFISEEPFQNKASLQNISVELPSRFPLKQGIKLGGKWMFDELTQSNVGWTQDLIQQNHMISADVEHLFHKSSVLVGLGADIMVANTNKGWVSQYYGNDRLRGWLKYAF